MVYVHVCGGMCGVYMYVVWMLSGASLDKITFLPEWRHRNLEYSKEYKDANENNKCRKT